MLIPKLVSTVIPVHNRPHLLREAVKSVIDQTYRPVEIVVVDDGSTDETLEVIRELTARFPKLIRSIRRTNGGPGAARESGRQIANGEYIQYLDSDDLLLPDKFALQVTALESQGECGIAYGKTHQCWVGDVLIPVAFKRTGQMFEYLFPELLRARWWSTSTPLYRRTVTDKIGPWMSLWNEEDWEYEARAARLGVRLAFCDAFVSVTRWHDRHQHHGGTTDPVKLKSRATAHALIYRHAREAGIRPVTDEMHHFSRELFLLARQCGAAGLCAESVNLYNLAREASCERRRRGLDYRLYGVGARLLGWQTMGRLAQVLDRLRP